MDCKRYFADLQIRKTVGVFLLSTVEDADDLLVAGKVGATTVLCIFLSAAILFLPHFQ
jgi:hypothetical protein